MLIGAIPERHRQSCDDANIDTLFRIARGRTPSGCVCAAGEMAKWFSTNYHYIVPELGINQAFKLGWQELFEQVSEAQQFRYKVKSVLIGPVTYLFLAKCAGEEFDKLTLLDSLLNVYQ